MRTRWHKYKAKSSKCYQGHYHPSKLESGYCDQIHMVLKDKESDVIKVESQVRFDLIVNEQKICAHIVDFLVTRKGGTVEVHECKGYAHPVWNIKRKLFEAVYPNIEYIVIR